MELNDLQKEIIAKIEGAFLISAPVGTGKTTVLAERVINAIDSGIRPEEILCLTFTNRAAEEMAQKIRIKLKNKSAFDALTMMTFHGFCAYFIKAEAKEIGITADFVIFDDEDQVETIKKALENYPEASARYAGEKRGMLDLIGKLYEYRLSLLESKIGCKVKNISIDKVLLEVNDHYLRLLNDQNALDFNELVVKTIETLYTNEKVRDKWASRYKFIQVDEFQDTHLSEYLVIKELAKTHKNIALIGDLDQTIYGWRGSEPYFITELFKSHFAPVTGLSLEINYRFSAGVINAVRSFLPSFKSPATKKITSSNSEVEGEKGVKVFGGHNLTEEIGWVTDTIADIKKADPAAKIAVLTRANYLVNRIAEVFDANGIAHITVDKYDFFRKQEVKDIYAYLKIIFNKFDLSSAYRLVLRPSRNIGLATLKTINEQGALIGLKISDFLNFKNYRFSEPFIDLIKQYETGRIIVLDTETTGTNVLSDEIVQVYAVEIVNGKPGLEFHHYLKNSIPVGSSEAVHGLSDEFLRTKGQEPKKILTELQKFIGSAVIVGHNINFDLSMITLNGKRQGIGFEIKEYYDTLDLSKRLIESENYKLSTLANLLGLAKATHDAQADVMATVDLLGVLIKKLKVHSSERGDLFKKYSEKFIQLSSLINNWEAAVREKRPAEALEFIWENSGLKDHYQNDKEKDRRSRSIETLIRLFSDQDDPGKPADIVMRELINYASLVRDINFLGLDQGKIPVVTVHQVKGLEFDYVFLVGINERPFPLYNAQDMEEERRIFYVAMTRARKGIYISYSKFDQYSRPQTKSRFIDCIDSRFVDVIS